MAKKVRTPAPPRVQAPQRRETRRAAGVPTRPPWFYGALGAGAVAIVAAIVIGVILLRDNSSGSGNKTTTTAAGYNALPGVRKTKAPWPPEYEFLADRLLPLGLNTLSQEGVATPLPLPSRHLRRREEGHGPGPDRHQPGRQLPHRVAYP